MAQLLRRTRGDLTATGIISTLALIAVGTVWATAPIRGSELQPATTTFIAEAGLSEIPVELSENWRTPDTTPNHRPAVTGGVIVAAEDNTVHGYSPTGEQLWSYTRGVDLCTLSTGFESAVATYRTGLGCGDVVAISVTDGQYKATRSAIASDMVAPIASNDRIGTVSTERVELWRSDLVRTVEYGEVEARQEAGQQPFPQCSVDSAMTRRELLVVTETCPDGSSFLRFQNTTPEDSREPEVTQNIEIPAGRLVAVAQEAAAVYLENPAPTIVSYNSQGQEVGRQPVAPAAFPEPPSAAATADLPHHMSWFDGQRLTLFTPTNLGVGQIFEDALGTGVAVDGALLYPVADGIAVSDWDTGEVLRTIPVDRGGYIGPVSLSLAGDAIVEKRGAELVALRP